MEVKIEIRFAAPEDSESIARVLAKSFAEHKSSYTPRGYAATVPTEDEIKKRFGEGAIWVAARGDEIIGTVSVVDRYETLYIRSMAVLPQARKQKIGESLLRRVENFALERGYQRLSLSTTPFLHRAIKLYENFGFKRNADEPRDLFGTPLFTMVKNLNFIAEVNNSQ